MTNAISNRCRRVGSAMVLLIFLLPVVLAVCAYVINVVYMELARTELQIATDVATRAAGRTLAVTGSEQEAKRSADRLLRLNTFVNQPLSANDTKIVFGASTRLAENQRYDFEPGGHPNAVSVVVGGNIKVPMLFPTMGLPMDFRPIKSAISTQSELDIAIVLDRSGSMAFSSWETAGDYPPATAPLGWKFGMFVPAQSRWLDAVNSVNSFVEYLSSTSHNEQISLITYSDRASIETSLTSDYSRIGIALQKQTLQFDGGATNTGDGITFGASTLGDPSRARPWASRVLIVLTDGNWTTGVDPRIAARNAAKQNVLIFAITFSNEADQIGMAEIAAIGNGQHFHASSGLELNEAFRAIAKSLPTLLTE